MDPRRHSPGPRTRLELTQRGRLVRTIVLAIVTMLVVTLSISLLRALTGGDSTAEAPPSASSASSASSAVKGPPSAAASDGGGASDAGGADPSDTAGADPSDAGGADSSDAGGADPEAAGTDGEDPDLEYDSRGLARSDDVGDGTWSIAPESTAERPEGAVRTYAVRVENGLDIDAADAAAQIEAILGDARGWSAVEGAAFHRVGSAEEADFTITLASPPTTDALCAPLRTGGRWSCHASGRVVLNSDRWTYMTPTYTDLGEYRAYLVNHEVGHLLGHGHARCPGQGAPAPVMLQQSMDLQGCAPNAWPAAEG